MNTPSHPRMRGTGSSIISDRTRLVSNTRVSIMERSHQPEDNYWSFARLSQFFVRMRNLLFNVLLLMMKNKIDRPVPLVLAQWFQGLQMLSFPLDTRFNDWGGTPAATKLCSALYALRSITQTFMNFPPSSSWYILQLAVAIVPVVLCALLFLYAGVTIHNHHLLFMAPLRVLHFLLNIITGVLYIPILSMLSTSMSTGSLMVASLSGATALLFVPMTLICRLCFFDANPLTKSYSGRLHSRMVFASLTFRTILTILFSLVRDQSYNVPIAWFTLLGFMTMLMGNILYLPYRAESLNKLVICQSSVQVLASIGALLSLVAGPPPHSAVFSVILALILPMIAATWFAADLWVRSWYQAPLDVIDEIIGSARNEDEGESDDDGGGDDSGDEKDLGILKLGLAGADQAMYKLVRQAADEIEGRFWSPYHVELCTRFLHRLIPTNDAGEELRIRLDLWMDRRERRRRTGSTHLKSGISVNAQDHEESVERQLIGLGVANLLLERGSERFPKSLYLLLCKSHYLTAYADAKEKAVDSDAINLQMQSVAESIVPALDTAFMMFRHQSHLNSDAQTQDASGVVSAIQALEKRKDFQTARRSHRAALSLIAALWERIKYDTKSSSGKSTDVASLDRLTTSIAVSRNSALKAYESLLETHPHSIDFNRAFGGFVDEVLNDPDRAKTYFSLAETLEANEMRVRTWKHKIKRRYSTVHSNWCMINFDVLGRIMHSSGTLIQQPPEEVEGKNIVDLLPFCLGAPPDSVPPHLVFSALVHQLKNTVRGRMLTVLQNTPEAPIYRLVYIHMATSRNTNTRPVSVAEEPVDATDGEDSESSFQSGAHESLSSSVGSLRGEIASNQPDVFAIVGQSSRTVVGVSEEFSILFGRSASECVGKLFPDNFGSSSSRAGNKTRIVFEVKDSIGCRKMQGSIESSCLHKFTGPGSSEKGLMLMGMTDINDHIDTRTELNAQVSMRNLTPARSSNANKPKDGSKVVDTSWMIDAIREISRLRNLLHTISWTMLMITIGSFLVIVNTEASFKADVQLVRDTAVLSVNLARTSIITTATALNRTVPIELLKDTLSEQCNEHIIPSLLTNVLEPTRSSDALKNDIAAIEVEDGIGSLLESVTKLTLLCEKLKEQPSPPELAYLSRLRQISIRIAAALVNQLLTVYNQKLSRDVYACLSVASVLWFACIMTLLFCAWFSLRPMVDYIHQQKNQSLLLLWRVPRSGRKLLARYFATKAATLARADFDGDENNENLAIRLGEPDDSEMNNNQLRTGDDEQLIIDMRQIIRENSESKKKKKRHDDDDSRLTEDQAALVTGTDLRRHFRYVIALLLLSGIFAMRGMMLQSSVLNMEPMARSIQGNAIAAVLAASSLLAMDEATDSIPHSLGSMNLVDVQMNLSFSDENRLPLRHRDIGRLFFTSACAADMPLASSSGCESFNEITSDTMSNNPIASRLQTSGLYLMHEFVARTAEKNVTSQVEHHILYLEWMVHGYDQIILPTQKLVIDVIFGYGQPPTLAMELWFTLGSAIFIVSMQLFLFMPMTDSLRREILRSNHVVTMIPARVWDGIPRLQKLLSATVDEQNDVAEKETVPALDELVEDDQEGESNGAPATTKSSSPAASASNAAKAAWLSIRGSVHWPKSIIPRSPTALLVLLALLYWILWVIGMFVVQSMTIDEVIEMYQHYYGMAIGMMGGSFVAGSTPFGGGVIGGPVAGTLYQLPPGFGRDFSLLIQSVGMTCASLYIVLSGATIEWKLVSTASISGAISTILTTTLTVAGGGGTASFALLTNAVMASVWAGFACGLIMNRLRMSASSSAGSTSSDNPNSMLENGKRITCYEHGQQKKIIGWTDTTAELETALFGLIGGVLTALQGVGIDTVMYTVATLYFGLDPSVGIPSVVIIMAISTVVGAITRYIVVGAFHPVVWQMFLVCWPICVVGAPLGAHFQAKHSGGITQALLFTAIGGQTAWVLLVIWRKSQTYLYVIVAVLIPLSTVFCYLLDIGGSIRSAVIMRATTAASTYNDFYRQDDD